ncbi:uncharacterized protein LOC114940986 [Nylanderia fulva]|uniref:uncharacterized protein LOC114940986 n=1 Tax=Nylanderia fulva TaxID=613905 RepID=UPI0010FAF63E|nr:uncharacterized protein LOC114940986 [Nylanderia fulva]
MAAHILAGVPPLNLLAEMYSKLYRRTKEIRRGVPKGASEELDREVEVARSQAWRSLMAQWQRQLADYGHLEIVRAVQPVFDRWMDGSRGLTYEMSQILSGHGCFGEYLFRIGRKSAPTCRACNSVPDSVAHTLQECPAWAEERRELRAELRVGYLTIPAIVDAIAVDEDIVINISNDVSDDKMEVEVITISDDEEKKKTTNMTYTTLCTTGR